MARSLKASVGPWNSSSRNVFGAELRERRHRRMAERAVGLARHARRDRPRRSRRRRTAGSPRPPPRHRAGRRSRRSVCGRKPRPGLRHIEAAVAGEARERDIDEAERRGLAAGGDVAHRMVLERDLERRWRHLCGCAGFHKERISSDDYLWKLEVFGGASRRRAPPRSRTSPPGTAASPYQVMAYCRWSLRRLHLQRRRMRQAAGRHRRLLLDVERRDRRPSP